MSELVSAIITTYNRKNLLKRAIESVRNQSYRNIEIIVIDDCSSDGTYELMNSLEYEDIQYIRNEKNLDAQDSRNKAIALANGVFVATLDDDDFWHENKIEYQMRYAYNYSIVGCLHSFDFMPKRFAFVPYKPDQIIDRSISQFLKSNVGFSPSKILCKREVLVEIGGYDRAVPGPEGIDLFIRIVEKFGKAGYINAVLVVHQTDHGLGRITTSKRMVWGSIAEYKKNYASRTEEENVYRRMQVYVLMFKYSGKSKWLLAALSCVRVNNLKDSLRLLRIRLIDQSAVGVFLLAIYRRIKYV